MKHAKPQADLLDLNEVGKGIVSEAPLRPGDAYILADLGGGTADICCHEIMEGHEGAVQEINVPSGGPWGSTFIDDEFFKLLRKILPKGGRTIPFPFSSVACACMGGGGESPNIHDPHGGFFLFWDEGALHFPNQYSCG